MFSRNLKRKSRQFEWKDTERVSHLSYTLKMSMTIFPRLTTLRPNWRRSRLCTWGPKQGSQEISKTRIFRKAIY